MVDLVCTDPLKIPFALLELGALPIGYNVVQLQNIGFLPALWSAMKNRVIDNHLPWDQIC